jgi:hypothetical protein
MGLGRIHEQEQDTGGESKGEGGEVGKREGEEFCAYQTVSLLGIYHLVLRTLP